MYANMSRCFSCFESSLGGDHMRGLQAANERIVNFFDDAGVSFGQYPMFPVR